MKLRELLGSPDVHIFMPAHTLCVRASRSRVVVDFARERRRELNAAVYVPCVYSCTGILGVPTLRLALDLPRQRNARAERKKATFRNENDAGDVSDDFVGWTQKKKIGRAVHWTDFFRNLPRNSRTAR